MKKHIMLMFLSDVKVARSGRIEPVKYEGVGEAATTNESAVRYLLQQEEGGAPIRLDRMFAFATNLVQGEIYRDGKKKEKLYYDEAGQTWTHLGYFQNRLLDVLPAIAADDFLVSVSYDEESAIQESKGTILEMAGRIMEYVGLDRQADPSAGPEQVVLHVDLTGGPRHANMMMLAVVRLLQYNGIEIGKVLYSDYNNRRVEEANDIYDLFDLIAGADEFVQFGSVLSILRYFGYEKKIPQRPAEISPELHELLAAMNGFAEEIKLCHYGAFRAAIDKLRKALKQFMQKSDDPGQFNDRLMRQLQIRVWEEYKDILGTKDVDDLQLIEWCINRDYLQQALTLYTERVPELVLKRYSMLQPTEGLQQRIEEAMDADDKRSPEFYLFSVYEDKQETSDRDTRLSHGLRESRRNLKKQLAEVLEGKHPVAFSEFLQQLQLEGKHLQLQDPAQLQTAYAKLQAWSQDPALLKDDSKADDWQRKLKDACRQWSMDGWRLQDPKLDAEALDKKWAGVWNYGINKRKQLIRFIKDMNMDQYLTVLFSDIVGEPFYWTTVNFRQLLESGEARHDVPVDDICRVRYYYSLLKEERNRSNHARIDNKTGQAEVVRSYLKDGVESMRKAIQAAADQT